MCKGVPAALSASALRAGDAHGKVRVRAGISEGRERRKLKAAEHGCGVYRNEAWKHVQKWATRDLREVGSRSPKRVCAWKTPHE